MSNGVSLVGTLLLAIALPVAQARAQDNVTQTPAARRHLELVRKGGKLWPIYCNHCHNAREPSEFAPYQWDQIIRHMRTIENLTPANADALLEYLKTSR